jgi:hypothetical protein
MFERIIMKTDLPPIQVFVDLVRANQKDEMVVCEVGVWKGETFSHYAPLVKNNNGYVIAIDWFKGNPGCAAEVHGWNTDLVEERRQIFFDNIAETGTSVTTHENDSLEVAKELADESIDICLLDSSVEYEDVLNNIKAYLSKVKPGGILCGYNLNQNNVRRAVTEVFGETFEELQDMWYPDGQSQLLWLVRKEVKNVSDV